jgi:hypothetical protein
MNQVMREPPQECLAGQVWGVWSLPTLLPLAHVRREAVGACFMSVMVARLLGRVIARPASGAHCGRRSPPFAVRGHEIWGDNPDGLAIPRGH